MIKRGRSPLDYEYGRYFPGEAGKRRQKDLEKSYMTERNMQGLSEKVFLRLEAPSEEEHVSDQMRIRQGLEEKGYRDIRFSLAALRTLYPLCREAGWEITVTLVHEEQGILITAVEAGDRTREHYGLAVDYGSTTILMQIVDMNTGEVLAEESETNGQAAYGADILTRLTCGKEEPGTQKRTSSGDGGDFSPASGEADRENRDSGRRMSGDGDIGQHDDGALLSGAGRLDRIFFSLCAGDNRTGIFPGKGTGTEFCGRGIFYAGDFQLCGRRYCQRPSSDGFLPEG